MAETADDLDAVADALYALPPEEFTAARNARAAEASGELAKRIGALRKPAVAAWAVNLLVRDGQLGQAVELSAALREAQDELSAAELRQLGAQRRQLVASLVRRAAALAQERGAALSPAVRDAVSHTINAAVLDEAAAAAVLSGRLVKPLEPGETDAAALSALVAGTLPHSAPTPAPARDDLAARRARKAAETAAREAERAASDAARELARIEVQRTKAHERAERLHERVEELRAELDRMRQESETADAELAEREQQRDAAASRAEAATVEAERARAAVPPAP